MDEERARKLARHRVGEDQHMGIPMTAEEIKLRREYMRNMIYRVAYWRNVSDEQLDSMRIYKRGTDWYIEDQDGYEYSF